MPKLKRAIANIDEVDETFRPLYVEKDGKYIMNPDIEFEGLVPASRLDEMRQTNIAERKKFETDLEKYKDVDPEKYRDLLGREKDLEEGKLVKRGELQEIRKSAVEEALKPWVQKEQSWEKEKRDLNNRLTSALLGRQIITAALPMGLKKGATKDLLARAERIFKLDTETGELKAFEEDGTTPKYKAGDPYTFDDFVKDTSESDDGKHLFEENRGGGGSAVRGGSGGQGSRSYQGEINPWDPKTINRTLQGQILQKDRPKAIRMAKMHGINIPEVPFQNVGSR